MTRELTPEEKALINDTKNKYEKTTQNYRARRIKTKRDWFFKKLWFWIVFILSIPTILTMIMTYMIFRAKNLLGDEIFNEITNKSTHSDVKEMFKQMGFQWIPQTITYYNNRWLIIGTMYAIALTIIIVMILVKLLFIKMDENNK